jgi:ferredoxin
MWRVRVESTCIGSGGCVGIAPKRFALGADNYSHPVADEIEPDDDVLDAAASCPMEAIVIVDTETGETVEP